MNHKVILFITGLVGLIFGWYLGDLSITYNIPDWQIPPIIIVFGVLLATIVYKLEKGVKID